MRYPRLQRYRYEDESGEPPRHDSSHHAEDLRDFFLPLARLHNAALHTWGIVAGLEVRGELGGVELAVEPGVAVDGSGQLVVLKSGPDGQPAAAILPVGEQPGLFYVTIQFNELLHTEGGAGGRLEQDPWLRLQPVEDFDNMGEDGLSVVLAVAELAASEEDPTVRLAALAEAQPDARAARRLAGHTLGEVALAHSQAAAPGRPPEPPAIRVGESVVARLSATAAGLALSVKDGERGLTISPRGYVGIGAGAPDKPLHIRAGGRDATGVSNARLVIENTSGHKWFLNTWDGFNQFSIGKVDGKDDLTITEAGSVGIGTTIPQSELHVRTSLTVGPFSTYGNADGRIVASGWAAELVFVRRELTSWPAQPAAGDRYLWYNYGGVARLWTERVGDRLSVDTAGNLRITGGLFAGGGKGGYVVDYFVNRVGDTLEQGDVVVIGPQSEMRYYGGQSAIPVPEVDLTGQANDRRVCGVVHQVATQDLLPLEQPETDAPEQGNAPPHPLAALAAAPDADPTRVADGQMGQMVTLGAYAFCKVDADIAPIAPGDLLTTSPTRGHAQKALDPAAASGAILGKALAGLESGRGKIPVMVTLL